MSLKRGIQTTSASAILQASRTRSGSIDDNLDSPPNSPPPPPPDVEPPNFPPVYKADTLTRANKVASKVSRIKEMFQTTNGAEEPQQHKFQPIKTYQHQITRSPPPNQPHTARSPPPHKARSPPPALQPKSPPPHPTTRGSVVSPTHKSREPVSPPTKNTVTPSVRQPSNHVQRFNYTRALFARMDEETRKKDDKDKMLRRPSPTHGATSPVNSLERKHVGSLSSNKSQSTSNLDAAHKFRALSDSNSKDGDVHSGPVSTRRSRPETRPPIPSRKPDVPRPAFSEPNIPKAATSLSNTPAGLLWKRRQNDIMSDINNTDKYHDSRNRGMSSSSSQLEENTNSNDTLDTVFSNSNGSLSEDLSVTSAYHSKKPYFPSDNINFSQGRSASTEVLNVNLRSRSSSNEHSRSLSNEHSRSLSNEHKSESEDNVTNIKADKGDPVRVRTRPDKATSGANTGKRLSKEEIQAAIDRADTYLHKTSTSSDDTDAKDQEMTVSDITQNKSTEQTRSGNGEPIMSKSDTSLPAAGDQPEQKRSWARYRDQRYSRTSDCLDDKVGDVSKLGSISDISVSGYRKESVENLSNTSANSSNASLNKPVDIFAAISQSSITMPRRSVKTAENPPTSNSSETSPRLSDGHTAPETKISEVQLILNTDKSKTSDGETSDSSTHSITTKSGPTTSPRPIPIPRRTAPLPPNEPPPPAPDSHASTNQNPQNHSSTYPANQNHSIPQRSPPPYSSTPPTRPPPEPRKVVEEELQETRHAHISAELPPVTKIEAELPPVPLRNKEYLMLEELEESSDCDPVKLETTGSRQGVFIESSTELPQREDGDGTEHPTSVSSPTSDYTTSLLSHDLSSLPPPPAYPGHTKYQLDHTLGDDNEAVEEEEVDFLEIDGLSSTTDESDEDFDDYEYRKDKKIVFSRAPIKVFMTYSTEDYDRRNDTVDPVAASAEYELEKRVERMDVFPVDLVKGSEGLGLSIIGMGVGADAGLEKLGIFIKTLTDGGAAQKSGKMQVNDQIIEVDGKSLVGVTQAYAASVLRNTSGEVKFMIGREKDPSKSEVARLIQESLNIDRKREELRRQEAERLSELQDQFQPRDEVLEHEHQRHVSETSFKESQDERADLDETSSTSSSSSGDHDGPGGGGEEQDISEDMLAGEATPMSMPSMADTDSAVSSPEESSKPVVEVFELQESSGDDFSPDMDSQALFVKLKEAQCKNAVTEGELTKLKAKVIVLENTEGQKRQYEKKCEEMATRLRDTEKSLKNARIEINQYKDMMEGSQGEYIALERRMKGDFTALEKKYHKAKKLIKEYQQREKDFIAERESLLQQQTEKDQQYNALVKSLKDRIFQLEGELAEAQTAAGLPVLLPKQDSNLKPVIDQPISPVTASTVRSVPPKRDSGSSLTAPLDSVSSESDVSSAGQLTPGREDQIKADAGLTFESVPTPQLLDTSVHKAKAQAANNSRRPPTKQRSKESVEGIEAQTGEDKHNESGLETWIKHDSDNTVKKSDVKKRKAQQLAADTEASQRLAAESEAAQRLVDSEATPLPVHKAPSPVEFPTPPPPPTSLPPQAESDTSETSPRHRSGSESGESSSTVSQTSYDPSNPQFRSHSEIPGLDTVSVDTGGTSHSAESESSNVSVKKSKGFLPKLPFKKFGGGDKDKGGAMLVSTRSLNTDDSEGGITLISKKKINTDLDFDGASTISDSSSGYMVGEVESTSYSFSGTPANQEHPSQMSSHSQNQIQSCGISEWTNEHVRHWLIGIEMEKYTQLFTDRSITGPQLLQLDANKLKTWGINNAKDREVFKKKFKELKIVLDKERKQLEKERRQLEKEQKAREKEQKKMSKKK